MRIQRQHSFASEHKNIDIVQQTKELEGISQKKRLAVPEISGECHLNTL